METGRIRVLRITANQVSPLRAVILACVVACVSYLASRAGGALILRPQMVWPLWPGCALLVAMVLLLPRRLWPILIPAGFAGFVLYDLQAGVSVRSTALLILADTIEVLTAALGIRYLFGGVPRLDSVKALAKYSVFGLLIAPLSVTLVGAIAFGGDYWVRWRISFFSEALAFLMLAPAILSWFNEGKDWAGKPRAYYFEAAALLATLLLLGYFTFVARGSSSQPALLYSLLPFLLWAALRFGSLGITTSMVVVAFLSIWGAIHGRGPFTGAEPLKNVLSLQLFLFFAATPFMVLAVLVEEQKHAAHALRESEERFRVVANSAPVLIWMSGTDMRRTFLNQRWLDFTGHAMDEEIGEGWASGIHPQDLDRCLETYSTAFKAQTNFSVEYRLRRFDGEYRWMVDCGVPRYEAEGTFCGYIGSCLDFTDRKLSENALLDMSGRLITAHEEERTRIARELHDDLSQRMALVQIGIEQMSLDSPNLSRDAKVRLKDITRAATEISSDIHHLSHQLHPSKLDTLGLVAAVGGYCREFSEQHVFRVHFVHHDVPHHIPKDVTLCAYRIVQESLRNVMKHSGCQEASVELTGDPSRIELCVSDSGTGFDLESVRGKTGLGLISMSERLRLVGGELRIESQTGRGTKVHVLVPLAETGTNPQLVAKAVDRMSIQRIARNEGNQ
jgi:PAS domain S-box-containing protein